MKHISILFSLLFLFSISVLGQDTEMRPSLFRTKADFVQSYINSKMHSESLLRKSSQINKQRLDSIVHFQWNFTTDSWEKDSKEEMLFDANGNLTQYYYYFGQNDLKEWISDGYEEYIYDANNNLIISFYHEWNWKIEKFQGKEKFEYIYNESGTVTQKRRYGWDFDTEEWVYDHRFEYTYNADNNLTQSLESYWLKNTDEWVPHYQHFYNYNDNANLTHDSVCYWRAEFTEWINYSKNEYVYNENGITENISFTWQDNDWLPTNKLTYNYDSNGNIEQYIRRRNWNTNTNQWDSKTKEECIYNNTYSFNDLLLPYFYDNIDFSNTFNHQLLEVKHYTFEEDSNSWQNNYLSALHYSEKVVTSIDDAKIGNTVIYPNPVSDNLYFNFSDSETATFKLFDVDGKIVVSKNVVSGNFLNLTELTRGIYLYRLTTSDGVRCGKVLKQ